MKKWKCTVCGYMHEGDAPPEECPLCKAPAESFEEVKEEGSSRRWKCTVCGYIHEGEGPPDECPICKAGPDKFVEVDEEGNEIAEEVMQVADETSEGQAKEKGQGLLVRLMMKLHLHPISVHGPNGILPIAVIFLAVSVFLGIKSFEIAAFYNLVAVLVTMPLVLFTGYVEWQNRYRGAKSFIFFTKIACSVIVTLSLITLVAWRYFDPEVAGLDSPFRMIYFGIAVVMLVATGIAGHMGGKLVFGSRDLLTRK